MSLLSAVEKLAAEMVLSELYDTGLVPELDSVRSSFRPFSKEEKEEFLARLDGNARALLAELEGRTYAPTIESDADLVVVDASAA